MLTGTTTSFPFSSCILVSSSSATLPTEQDVRPNMGVWSKENRPILGYFLLNHLNNAGTPFKVMFEKVYEEKGKMTVPC